MEEKAPLMERAPSSTGWSFRHLFLLPALAFGLAYAAPASARTLTPAEWVQAFWPTAKAAGVSRNAYDGALGDFTPDPEVITKSQTQAEFKQAIWDYLDMMVSDDRITAGRAALVANRETFSRVESRYGVDRYVIAAIWGMESHYGAVLKNPKLVRNAIRSLATLAYTGGRYGKYGRQQLVAALKIVQRGDIAVRNMSGSWAGAMGQTQFIPTTYNAFAVDFDGDGHRNIWTSAADALASTANYLNKSGWRSGNSWGYEVVLPKAFDRRKTAERSLADWAKLGVTKAGGEAFPRPKDRGSLYLPGGAKGPAFLLLTNFRVIKRYNNSDSYALAIGHLSDRLRGYGAFQTAWPDHEPSLSLEEREKLQRLLTAKGYYSGEVDGDLGSGSREAIRNYQIAAGLNADGVGSRALLQALETGR
jgi:membrane-bound lytic murein transglycosylase B